MNFNKSIVFKTILICICVLYQGAVCPKQRSHKKTHSKKYSPYIQTTQKINRPDLTVVHITAKPVMSFSSELISDGKKNHKFDKISSRLAVFDDPRESLFNYDVPLSQKIPQISWENISSKIYTKNGKVYAKYNDLTLELTINPEIQNAAEHFLNQNQRIVSGSTVIIESKTGKLLALAQGGHKKNATISVSSRANAASLIKIVISAAAIDKEHLDPFYTLSFPGGCGKAPVNENWIENPKKDSLTMSFDKAFGSSCNTFFARLALYHVGLSSLKAYAEKFMFNKPIPSDIKIQTSLFSLPDVDTATPQEIAEAGSGFGATKLSPIHAALLSATVANNGIMMAPYLIEAAYDKNGHEIYRGRPIQIGRVVSEETANKLSVLMLATTSLGTSRRVFNKVGTQDNLDDIGGKTGTLLDLENRQILYTWFSGITGINSKHSIAIGTIVASPQNYVVRANTIAQTTIAEYFKLQKIEED